MTVLSVNVNKIALLRNSRGRDYPKLLAFVERIVKLGVKGITVHPRPDERHVTPGDVHDISEFLQSWPAVEFNIEGYPSERFMELVLQVRPAQCTLVPDAPGQLTSDHGWDLAANAGLLRTKLGRLHDAGIRSSLFMDPVPAAVARVAPLGADRIELYTEDYAKHFGRPTEAGVLQRYAETAALATAAGIGVNAGHDLDLRNLPRFLEIPRVLEVSIGHALVVESLIHGLDAVIRDYLAITGAQEAAQPMLD